MKLTKKALEDVRFSTRGKWYNARQVDAFLQDLAMAADEADREWKSARACMNALEEQADGLRAENIRLQKELQELKSAAPPDVLENLEQEKNHLLQDIKALKKFREMFREAVEKDAGDLAENVKSLASEKLL